MILPANFFGTQISTTVVINGTTVPFEASLSELHAITRFKAFICCNRNLNGNKDIDLNLTTNAHYVHFSRHTFDPSATYIPATAIIGNVSSASTASDAAYVPQGPGGVATPSSQFQRSIKLNEDDFPTLSKDSGWYSFKSDTCTVAAIQDVSDVLVSWRGC
jgi:hypothetical protein